LTSASSSQIKIFAEVAKCLGDKPLGATDVWVTGLVPSSDNPWSLDVVRHTIWLMGFSISLMSDKHVAYHSCTRVFTVWVVFPSHLFVLPSLLVQLMATHFVSCPLDPYKYSFYRRTIVDWNVLPASVKSRPSFIRSAVRYIPT